MNPASVGLTLAEVQRSIATRLEHAAEAYRRQVTIQLTAQQRVQLLQRALLLTVEQIYADTLVDLDALDLSGETGAVVEGCSVLTPTVLASFQGFSARLLEQALRFNAGSCALSNFPTERNPAADYLEAIRLDLAAAWRSFAVDVNLRMLRPASQHVASVG